MSNLSYRRIIITGASSGFGKLFAESLADSCKEMVLIARRYDLLQDLAEQLQTEHPELCIITSPVDLAKEESLSTFIDTILHRPPAKTLLINNAGVGDYGDFADSTWEKTRQLLRLNIESLTRLCHAFIPGMKEYGGDIINISSLAASLPIPDFAVYAASKAYVSSFSDALRTELKENGINVLAVCPGPVKTGFGQAARRTGFTGNMMPCRNGFDTTKETVVRDTLQALQRRKARIFPGMKIRLLAILISLIPLPMLRMIMGTRPRRVQQDKKISS